MTAFVDKLREVEGGGATIDESAKTPAGANFRDGLVRALNASGRSGSYRQRGCPGRYVRRGGEEGEREGSEAVEEEGESEGEEE